MDQLDGDNPLKNMKIPDNMVPTTENLEKLKRWGLKHYRVNRQRVQELMGTATITTEPELEPRVEKLQQQLIKYKELHMVCNFCQDTVTFDPDLWFLGQMKLRMVLLFLNKSISIFKPWFKNSFSEKKYRL